MHKHLTIDVNLLANEFEMDTSPPKLTTRTFLNYKKEMGIDMLFSYQTYRDLDGKTLITSLSCKDKIIHLMIYKILFP